MGGRIGQPDDASNFAGADASVNVRTCAVPYSDAARGMPRGARVDGDGAHDVERFRWNQEIQAIVTMMTCARQAGRRQPDALARLVKLGYPLEH
ncbi:MULTISPECIES: hypothetical protein [Burkholderia]|uniref:hypothetical protein n=1 Tax=Burkholderia TaxID=32008 RepID=UPI00145450FF|nr:MULTISPECIES: hypothetical protein [Burkholderia]MBN3772800.1 hypothetical protein [Burkholderia sp. Se-20378]MBN3796602.1 hypothetical protein [Burkholderia sp. Ac-20392]VWB44682.1 hypothetical protein BLA6860_02015 [Burkholderia lata]